MNSRKGAEAKYGPWAIPCDVIYAFWGAFW